MISYTEWKDKDLKLFEKRKEGAHKIAESAKAKGGPSILTSWHFYAKLPEYSEVLKVLKSDNPLPVVTKKTKSLIAKLSGVESMSQRHFQELMGEIEVWGETLIQLRRPENY